MIFHPFAEKFPIIAGREWAAFVESIAATSGNGAQPILYRIVSGQKQGLDGRNRERACEELGLKPTYRLVVCPDDEVKDFVLRLNVTRRHLTPETRRAIVQELRADGESTRQIADVLGVGKTTVERDLTETAYTENPGGPNGPTETIIGKDGKEYKTTRAVLCPACQQAVNGGRPRTTGCLDCKTAQHRARADKARARAKVRAAASNVKDNHGTFIPQGMTDAWCDPWIQSAYDFLTVWEEKFRLESLAKGMAKRQQHYPFFDATGFQEGCDFIQQYLDQLIEHLKGKRPDAVCPICDGRRCTDCRGSGLVPKDVYLALRKNKEERA